MKIGFLGAGKVGFTLGKYFRTRGAEVTGYYSRNIQSAKDAADFTETNAYAEAEALLLASDVLFFTVPDGVIASCYGQMRPELIRGKIFCHASGALTAEEAFGGIEAWGAFGYSVHPLFAVSDKYHAYEELADVFFAVEGSPARLDFMLAWLRGLGLNAHSINAAAKVKYHAAAAIVSNHVVGIFAAAQELLSECGIAADVAQQALGRLFLGNAQSVAERGAVAALTGPVQRGDTGTLAKHLSVLENADAKLLYILLSQRLAGLAKQKNPAFDEAAMRDFLAGEYNKVLKEKMSDGREEVL